MKSGLGDRNNLDSRVSGLSDICVSMKSGLRDRNNLDYGDKYLDGYIAASQ